MTWWQWALVIWLGYCALIAGGLLVARAAWRAERWPLL